jgi:hypothetical protein
VFVVVVVVAFGPLAGKTPGIKKSPADIADFYTKHHSKESAAAFILGIGTFFLALFVASAWPLIRDEGWVWSALFFGGGMVAVGGFLFAATVHLALADGANHGLDPVALQALNAIDADNYIAFGMAVGIMLLGGAGAMIPRTGALKWLGWIALLFGILSFTPLGFIGFVGAGVWIIAVSIVLFMQAGKAASSGAPAAAAA